MGEFSYQGGDHPPLASPAVRPSTPSGGNDADLWSRFAGARQADAFCNAWLSVQCAQIAGARAGLLLIREQDGVFTPAAIWPDRSHDIRHLVGAAETALRNKSGHVARPAEQGGAGEASSHHGSGDGRGSGLVTSAHLAYPIDLDGNLAAVVAVETGAQSEASLAQALRQLHWGAGWLEVLFRRERHQNDTESLRRSHFAIDMVAVAAEHRDAGALSRALATSLAIRLEARSVAVGLLQNRQIRLNALSHAATFDRNSAVVHGLENAMEEAVDQARTVAEPPIPGTDPAISLAHRDYLGIARSGAVVSAPLYSAGRIVGAITIERDDAQGFDAATLAMIESVGVLLGPMIDLHRQADRLISGHLISRSGAGLRALFGPRRPAIKLMAVTVLVALAALGFATGPFRIGAAATIEGAVQRAAVAPFDGFLVSAPARAGNTVREGDVLATLDDRELQLEAARWRSERDQHLLRYQEAIGKHERASARITEALVKQAEAQLAQVESKIERGRIKAPFEGIIVSGDLSQQLGTPVERGKLLFEIAPLDRYRVILQVDERDMPYLAVEQTGRLLVKGLTDASVALTVSNVTPVATAANGRNTFRVEAAITDPVSQLRPGMEGVAKLDIGTRSLLWIWTRALVDWARLTWWTWVA